MYSPGVYGVQGKDKCTHTLSITFKKPFIDTISAFNIILGTDIFFFGMITLVLLFIMPAVGFCYGDDHYNKKLDRALEVMCAVPAFITVVVLAYGLYLTKPIYDSYNSWKRETINCSSPVFYTAFAYVTLQYTVIGLIMIGLICIMPIYFVITESCCRNRYCSF